MVAMSGMRARVLTKQSQVRERINFHRERYADYV
jgi:hypothetical protein